MKFHRFDEEAAYESTFKGLLWSDGLPFMEGPNGRIPVTIAAAEKYNRERENAFGQGYRDLDMVLQHIKETTYWNAVKVIEDLTANGFTALVVPVEENEAI